jgi:hypothetical protein
MAGRRCICAVRSPVSDLPDGNVAARCRCAPRMVGHFYFMISQTIVQAMVATTTLPRTTSGSTHLRSRCGANVGNGNNDVLGATKPSANVENNRSITIARLPLHNVTLAGRPSELREVFHRYLQASLPFRSRSRAAGRGGRSFRGPALNWCAQYCQLLMCGSSCKTTFSNELWICR